VQINRGNGWIKFFKLSNGILQMTIILKKEPLLESRLWIKKSEKKRINDVF